MNRRRFLSLCATVGVAAALNRSFGGAVLAQTQGTIREDKNSITRIIKPNEEWKRILTPEQYNITRQGGTEAAYSSPLLNIHERGTFACVCCDLPLFSSKTKFDSQTGWPSFWAPIAKRNVREKIDTSLAETRTEVLCARCDAHLGHVFDDGPPPTGLRYCMNGIALRFVQG
ncbi:MAG TPA: peptide-methionine (R)-S-oxide reductase MsrB [Pyrinomonadaceae bacterium]